VVVSIGRYRRPDMADDDATPMGIAAGFGAVVMVVAGVTAAIIPAAYPGWRFGVIAVAVMAFAAVSLDHRALALVAAVGALIFNGFLEDSLGQLAWHSDDLWRLMLLVMAGGFGLAIGEGYRYVRDLRIRYRMADSIALFAPSTEEEKHGA
jgi:MFS family permease